jgi:hypothetical protein
MPLSLSVNHHRSSEVKTAVELAMELHGVLMGWQCEGIL